jgi:predicted nucleic acid-binding protein
MKSEVFLDAAYAIALSVPKDSYHQRAVLIADELEASKTRLVTTRAVILESGHFSSLLVFLLFRPVCSLLFTSCTT